MPWQHPIGEGVNQVQPPPLPLSFSIKAFLWS